nr:EpsG family protein [Helicobacter canis]
MLPSILLLIWLEKYGMQGLSEWQKSLCILLVFLFFNFVWTTWLTRQMISSVLILYSLSACTLRFKWFFAFLACLFHLTAIPILLILFACKKYPRTTIFIWLIALSIFTFLLEVLYGLFRDGLIPLDLPLLSKFGYYVFTGGENVSPHFNEVVMLICIFFAFLLPNDRVKSSYAYIFYIFFIMYFFLYFLAPGSMGQRSSLLLTSCLFGFFLFLALRRYYVFLISVCAVFLLLRIKSLIFAGEDESVRNFYSYPAYGDLFYYL